MRLVQCICLVILPFYSFCQYDPAGGETGSNAIHRDNGSLSYWGDSVIVERGSAKIGDVKAVEVTLGSASDALGKPDNYTISLGDGGKATYFFERTIQNIQGPDFVVFENGFEWAGGYFLELAFVEVSSDGKNFVRFPSKSAADTAKQIENLSYMECVWYHNLAGKHQAPFGTPFDLDELKDSQNIDITSISHIRIVDVIGCLNDSFATYDSDGKKINDPWPTNFESSGFDLDAIGVLQFSLSDKKDAHKRFVLRNPVNIGQRIPFTIPCESYEIVNEMGQVLLTGNQSYFTIPTHWKPGIYYVRLTSNNSIYTQKICVLD